MRPRNPSRRAVALLVAMLVVLVAPTRPGAAGEPDALGAARRAQAKRLAGLGGAATDAKLGALALRLFEDAHALDPANDDARLALGWTKDGAVWRPPASTVVPGEGWADDGDAELARFEKKVADARAAFIKELLGAAGAAKARKDAAEADRCLWAAIAVDPTDPEPRRIAGHRDVGGRWLAPVHVDLAGRVADVRAAWLEAGRRLVGPGAGEPADPPTPSLAGWPRSIAKGVRGASGDAAYALVDDASTGAVARRTSDARGLVAGLVGGRPGARPVAYLTVPSHDVAETLLLGAEVDKPSREAARAWPVWPLGKTGFDLLVADGPGEAVAAAVDTVAQREAVGRARDREATRWIAFGMGFLATNAVLGSPQGYGTSRRIVAGDHGPAIRPDEGGFAYVRRLAALGADRSIRALATLDARELLPADAAKAGALLDFLFLADGDRARAFVAAILGGADRAAAIEDAAKAAGYPSADALDDAWRRWAFDTYPAPVEARVGAGGPWKVTKLHRTSATRAEGLFGSCWHPVTGTAWLGGRPYRCRVVDAGAGVEVEPKTVGGAPRIVRAPGDVPFAIAREFGGGLVEVRMRLEPDGTGWRRSAADAWAGSIDGIDLAFEDLDADGRWGGFGRDGYAFDYGRVFPLRQAVVVDARVIELRRVGPDGREVAWRTRPLGPKGPIVDALRRWNAWRVEAGLPGLLLDDASCAQAAADAAAGASARGLVGAGSDLLRALDRWVADVATRARLFDPAGVAAGLAIVGDRVAVRVATDDAPSAFVGPLVVPGSGETPVPAADATGRPLPITLTFAPGTDVARCKVDVALAGRDGAKVDLDVEPHPELDGTLVVRPRTPLAPKTAYTLLMARDGDGTLVVRETVFVTGG